MQQEGEGAQREDRGRLPRALRPRLRAPEEPLLPKELPDRGGLVRKDLVGGHQGELHHVDEVGKRESNFLFWSLKVLRHINSACHNEWQCAMAPHTDFATMDDSRQLLYPVSFLLAHNRSLPFNGASKVCGNSIFWKNGFPLPFFESGSVLMML